MFTTLIYFIAQDKQNKMLPAHLDAHPVLWNCPDFQNEVIVLEKLIQGRGRKLFLSPKCTPELARGGLEYCWGN